MKPRAILALGVACIFFVLPAHAGEVRAFSNLEFGDSRGLVARKIRENLDEGTFRRDCYKCPVRVAIGRYGLDITPEFSSDRLWQVSLRHVVPPVGSKGPEELRESWSLIRQVIAARYSDARRTSVAFPELTSSKAETGGIDVVTDTWIEESKRLVLVVSVAAERRASNRSLRERILSGWFSGGDQGEEEFVTYAIEVRITSTEMDAPSDGRDIGKATEREAIERASQLF